MGNLRLECTHMRWLLICGVCVGLALLAVVSLKMWRGSQPARQTGPRQAKRPPTALPRRSIQKKPGGADTDARESRETRATTVSAVDGQGRAVHSLVVGWANGNEWQEERLRSPWHVPPDIDRLAISAPGFVERDVRVDRTAGGAHVFLLEPEGRVELDFVDPPIGDVVAKSSQGRVRRYVYDEATSPRRWISGRWIFSGLSPGRWRIDAAWATPAFVDVRTGETARAMLRFHPPALNPIRVRVEIRAPAAWGDPELLFYWRHIGWKYIRRTVPGAFDVLRVHGPRFEIGPVPPGLLWFRIDPFSMFEQRLIRPDGMPIVFEIPEPAEVTVEAVEGKTNRPIEMEHINWYRAGNGGGSTRIPKLRVAAGKITIEGTGPGFYGNRELTLRPGQQTVRLAVYRRSRVLIHLREGDRTWILPAWLKVSLHGPGESRRDGTGFLVSKPGQYELSITRHPAFKTFPRRTVYIDEGKTTDIILDVERFR